MIVRRLINRIRKFITNTIFIIVFMANRIVYNRCSVDDNLIVFYSIPSFSDNPRALYRRMLSRDDCHQYRFVWLIDENYNLDSRCVLDQTEFIVLKKSSHVGNTLKSMMALSKAKYIFFDHINPIWRVKQKKNQKIINLWHGCGYKDTSKGKPEGKWFDFALVPGELFINAKIKAWNCERNQIIDIGYPRYDELMAGSSDALSLLSSIKKENSYFIMWMPTFRKTGNNEYTEESIIQKYDFPLFSSTSEMIELDKYCVANGIVLCIKRHPFQRKYLCEDVKFRNICFIDQATLEKNNSSLYELLHYADALISDYSSVSVDYLLLNRPIAYTLDDYESYHKTRGFVFENPLQYMPGNHLYNLSDLYCFLKQIMNGEDLYAVARSSMISSMHNTTKNYCDRITEYFGLNRR